MKESFDSQIRNRLEELEVSPSNEVNRRTMEKIESLPVFQPNFGFQSIRYLLIAAVLLPIGSELQWKEELEPTQITLSQSTVFDAEEITVNELKVDKSWNNSGIDDVRDTEHILDTSLLSQNRFIYSKGLILNTTSPSTPPIFRNQVEDRTSIGEEKKDKLSFYLNLGISTQFNEVFPSANDGILIKDFQSVNRYALRRMSLNVGVGMSFKLLERFRVSPSTGISSYRPLYLLMIQSEETNHSKTAEVEQRLFNYNMNLLFEYAYLGQEYDYITLGFRYNAFINPKQRINDLTLKHENQLMYSIGYKKLITNRHLNVYIVPILSLSTLRRVDVSSNNTSIYPKSFEISVQMSF